MVILSLQQCIRVLILLRGVGPECIWYFSTVFFLFLPFVLYTLLRIYSVSQKSSPPKTFCNIFT